MQSPQCICTRHLPSTGGELLSADARHHPVRLRLPPLHRGGNCLVQMQDTTPSSFACHPSTGGELLSADARHHPVRLRHQVQMRCNRPSVSVLDISPPQEGNCLVQMQDTTPSGFACHPSTGGELLSADARHHPVRLRLPPPHRRGIA